MNLKQRFYPESLFSGFSDCDGTIAFYTHVNALVQPGFTVVDFGCGRGAYQDDPVRFRRELRILKGKCQSVLGLDVNPAAGANPFLDEFRLLENDIWPVEDGSANLILCDYVLEHLSNPERFFEECLRVLKAEGYLCIRTANALSYFGLFSRAIPNRAHLRVLKKVKERVKDQDTFPTFYRMNSVKKLKRCLRRHGFTAVVYGFEAEPGYLSFSRLSYWLGVIHQKHAPGCLKVGIHAFAQKPKAQQYTA
mgnify:CR=1 FL=1